MTLKSLKGVLFDARAVIFINNFALVTIGMVLLALQRTWLQILFGLVVAVATEFSLLYFQKGQREFRPYQFSSAMVTGIGLVLVVNAVDWWAYGALSFIGISSKYIFKKNERDHLFNPANFAIIFFLAIGSSNLIRIYSDQFAMNKYLVYQVLAVGLICCYMVNRLALVFSYALTMVGAAYLIEFLKFRMNFYDILGPELGVSALIFLFFMITDPRTSPSSWRFQVAWGIFVAVLSIIFKLNEVYYGRFLALFIATTLGAAYEVSRHASGKYMYKAQRAV